MLIARLQNNRRVTSSIIGRLLTLNITQVTICFVGGLASFLPIIVGVISNLEDTSLRRSLTSGYYFRDSSLASLTLAIPILIDILLDLTTSITKKRGMVHSNSTGSSCLNNIEKFMLLGGIISVPMTAFLPYDFPNLGLIFFCCKKYQTVVVTGVVMISLCRNNPKFWSVTNTIIFLIVLSTATTSSIFFRNNVLKDPTDMASIHLELACTVFQWAPIVFLIFCNIRWLGCMMSNFTHKKMHSKSPVTDKDRQLDSHTYFTTVWVLTTVIGMVYLVVMTGIYFTDDKFDVVALLVNNLIFLSLELSITVFLMRIVKSDVVQGLYALIDSKKSYVRYISHELRTPLNTAFLGLKLITDNMKASTDPKDVETYDTLRDVNLSCRTALDILNDLLCFDKLESGILQLHKQEISVIPFVTDCFAMFTIQARESGINMTIINRNVNTLNQEKVDINTNNNDNTNSNSNSINHSNDGITFNGEKKKRRLNRSFLFSNTTSSESRENLKIRNAFLSLPFDDCDFILIDKFKMDQVLRNLISNSLKFTPRGGNVTIQYYYLPDNINVSDINKSNDINQNNCYFYNDKNDNDNKYKIKSKNNLCNIPSIVQVLALVDDIESNTNRQQFINGYLIIEVTDSGAGISKENQKKLFTDIVQFNPEILQAGGGSGLGLWITQGIIDLHHGEINLFSDGEGKGCKFTVKIPMRRNIYKDGGKQEINNLVNTQARGVSTEKDTRNTEDNLMKGDEKTKLNKKDKKFNNSECQKSSNSFIFKDIDKDRNGDNYHMNNNDDKNDDNSSKSNKNDNNNKSNSSDNNANEIFYTSSNNSNNNKKYNDRSNDDNNDQNDKNNRLPSFMMKGNLKNNFCLANNSFRSNCKIIFKTKKDLKNDNNVTVFQNDDNNNLSYHDNKLCDEGIKKQKLFNSGETYEMKSNLSEFSKKIKKNVISYNLLVVDDSRLNRKMLCKILRNEGHVCEEAEDGLIAIQKIKDRMSNREANCTIKGTTYDAILMDYVMPNMDGPTATKEICALGYQGLIFGVTGNALDSDIEYFISCGAVKIFTKPLNVMEFTTYMKDSIPIPIPILISSEQLI